MHPFLDMPTFSSILASESPRSVFRLLKKFNKNTYSEVKLELLSQITCDEDETLRSKSFKITCNSKVPNNRKEILQNKSYIPVFGHVMVSYSSTEPDTVVKVMAIVHIGRRIIEHNKLKLGTVVLIVALMERRSRKLMSLPYESLSYSFDKNDLQFSVITLDMIRQPVCVIPEYSATQTVYTGEKFEDRTKYTSARNKIPYSPPVASQWRFFLVPCYNPVYDNANIGIVGSSSVSRSCNRIVVSDINSLFLDEKSLNLINKGAMDTGKLHISTDLDSEIHSIESDQQINDDDSLGDGSDGEDEDNV
jgi:hypothetical protein